MKIRKLALLLCVLVCLCALLASCGDATVKLTLVTNDGTAAQVVDVKQNEPYPLTEPTREGYTFAGWYTSADLSGAPVKTVLPTADMSVYAKWEKLYTLTLDADGGTLSDATVTLHAGDPIAAAIEGRIPTRTDCRFGMWLLDGEELASDAVMPAEDLTLTARYLAKYTVELYTQNTALDGYEKSETVITDYAYIGETFRSTQTLPGFREVTNTDSVTSIVISADTAQNLLRHYFDRAEFTMTFVSNFPDGSQNQTQSTKFIYGVETAIPFVTFDMAGYYLEGWSLTPGGEMVYYSHIMDETLYNATIPPAGNITSNDNVTLYAVWAKGYTDLFGGDDVIYVSTGEKETVYLFRGGLYFKGELDDDEIYFYDKSDDILYMGQLNGDGRTFLYLDQSRSEKVATLYEMGDEKGLNNNIKLYFDDANGVTYSERVTDDAGSHTVDTEGTYVFNDDGSMKITFTDGRVITVLTGDVRVSSDDATVLAFQIRNETEYELGELVHFTVSGNALVVDTDTNGDLRGQLTLNGFGTATVRAENEKKNSYYYTFDEETMTVTLMSAQGAVDGVYRVIDHAGDLGYIAYNAAEDATYTLSDGSVLTTDGMQYVTYEKDGRTTGGYYTLKASAFPNCQLLSFSDEDDTFLFMITTETKEIVIDPEISTEPETQATKTVERKPNDYIEYYYKDAKNTYYGPLLVIEDGNVTVYGYTSAKTFVKMASCTLTYQAATGTYTLTVTERFTAEDVISVLPADFSTVKSAVLMLAKAGNGSSVPTHVWLSYEDDEKTNDLVDARYTDDKGNELVFFGGMVACIGDKIELGTYKTGDDATTLKFPGRTATVRLDTEAKTFAYLVTPTTLKEVDKNFTIHNDRYIEISADSARYVVITTDDGGVESSEIVTGKITATNRTSLTGFPIYVFTSDATDPSTGAPTLTIEYIQRDSTTNGDHFFFPYDEAYAGTYTTENGVLKLDGFGLAATYGDDTGLNVVSFYQKTDNDVMLQADERNYFFLLDGTTCRLRGAEYGYVYLLMDNQAFWGKYVEPDGLGGAKIFTANNGVDEETGKPIRDYIDEHATYTLDGTDVVLIYQDGADTVTLECTMGIYQSDVSYKTFSVKHEEVISAYVNDNDWSVLILDGDGNATKYLKDGKSETGTYSLVTDTLLYYVNTAGTDAYIYVYDHDTGSAVPQNYDVYAYYTPDLESLLFTKYGFALFNNETRYYYTVAEDGNVTIYHLDPEDPTASSYGYVAEDFGKFTETKTYDDKTYYKNDGFSISFERDAETAGKYPVRVSDADENYYPIETLIFTPSGGRVFSVSGTVMLNGQSFSCEVVREADEDDNLTTYIRVGSFYFYISVEYRNGSGEESSRYEVLNMVYKYPMVSYYYYYYYYYIYSTLGSDYASRYENNYGSVEEIIEFDEEGNQTATYMNGTFGPSSNFYDLNGDLISSIDHAKLTFMNNGLCIATFEAADGYTYQLVLSDRGGLYNVYGLVRIEEVPANDGYSLEIGRILVSEAQSITPGTYFSFELLHNGEKAGAAIVMINNGKIYYVVRETDEETGAITETTYYELELTEKASEVIGGDTEEETDEVPLFESAKVTPISATSYVSEDGKDIVDVLPDHMILLIVRDGKNLLIAECQYDEATDTYTLLASDKTTYTVKIADGHAVVTPVPASEE